MIRRMFGMAVAMLLLVSVAPVGALATSTGTAAGTVKGPHGDAAASIQYAFTNKTTGDQIIGTTDSNGAFSQSLPSDVQYSLTITPDTSKSGFEYSDKITIPYIGVPVGVTFNMGTIYLPNKAGQDDPDLDKQAMQLPDQCTTPPVNGAPVISHVDYIDAAHGPFMYKGRDVGVVIYADHTGETVTADFSIPEGQQPGNTIVTATDNGDGSYTAHHILVNSGHAGGLVIASATGSEVPLTTKACSIPGPVNLDIRNQVPPNPEDGTTPLLTGSETTDFTQVADFRSLKNFTMHIDGVVKLVFPNAINMTDPNVQNFMKGMFKKLHKGIGNLSLDAKAVLELKNSGAQITFYNVPDYLSTPTVLLDGGVAGSAVSGLTYDRSAHTLTFSAAHFSTYTAVPTITFSSPDDKTTTTNTTQTIKGSVNDPSATVKIKVGSTDQGTVTVGSDGTFSKDVTLALGDNTVTISASNGSGSALDVSRTITRQALPVTGTQSWIVLALIAGLVGGITLRRLARANA